MKKAPINVQTEAERIDELYNYHLLDTSNEQSYDDITKLASQICGTPIALVSLVDHNRQWFKSKVGLNASETPRDISFCGHAIHEEDIFEIKDSTKDERFQDNPLVTGATNVIFYAGAQLVTPTGHKIGTLCVIDHKPSQLTENQKESLRALSRMVVSLFELRKKIEQVTKSHALLIDQSKMMALGDMSRSIAHEINNPLAIVLGRAQLMQAKFTKTPLNLDKLIDDNKKIITSAERIAKIVRALQLFTRQAQEQTREKIQINLVVESVLELLLEHARTLEIKITSEVASDVGLLINASEMANALNALLHNAMDAVQQQTEKWIKLKVFETENTVKIHIIDSGSGITTEVQRRMFQPFFTTKDIGQGVGMGLSVALGITKSNGGHLKYLPEQPNTTFEIEFPKL
jgi:two-component system, NtrC family, sensor kinase